MRSLRFFLFTLICASVAWSAVAAPPTRNTGPAAPRDKAEAFFNTIILGDTAKAFDTLLDGSTISLNKPEAASVLKEQLGTGVRVYGKPLGFDLVDSKSFGTSLVRLVYVLRMEKYPLTFEFFFYQSGRNFLPIDVRFNDKLDVYRYDRVPSVTDAPQS